MTTCTSGQFNFPLITITGEERWRAPPSTGWEQLCLHTGSAGAPGLRAPVAPLQAAPPVLPGKTVAHLTLPWRPVGGGDFHKRPRTSAVNRFTTWLWGLVRLRSTPRKRCICEAIKARTGSLSSPPSCFLAYRLAWGSCRDAGPPSS